MKNGFLVEEIKSCVKINHTPSKTEKKIAGRIDGKIQVTKPHLFCVLSGNV